MLHADREALLCDFAEYYHVYDLRALPVLTTAALAVGLRGDSRIRMKLAGITYVPRLMLDTAIADKLALIYYYLAADKSTPAPALFSDILLENAPAAKKSGGYGTVEEYEAARAAIINEVLNNG